MRQYDHFTLPCSSIQSSQSLPGRLQARLVAERIYCCCCVSQSTATSAIKSCRVHPLTDSDRIHRARSLLLLASISNHSHTKIIDTSPTMSVYGNNTVEQWRAEYNMLRTIQVPLPRLLHSSAVISPENPTADTTEFEATYGMVLWQPNTVELNPVNLLKKNPAIQVQLMQFGYTMRELLRLVGYPVSSVSIK